ncbi:Sialic acid transporter NanT [Streptomyces alboniger]
MSAAAPPTVTTDSPQTGTEKRKAIRRAIGAGSIGNFVEQFDYGLYGYMAPVLAPAFFPDSDPTTAVLSTYGIIAIACLFRPLGGTLVGRWGDRVGRKKTLLWTIVLMGVTTAMIGALPTYHHIGILAPLLLLLLRVVQGMVSGGEYVGAVAFIVEWAEPNRRGYYASYASNSCFVGILGGAGTAALTSWLFDGPTLDSWGWRVPFLLALPLSAVGIWLRGRIDESPEFVRATEGGTEVVEAPVKEALRTRLRAPERARAPHHPRAEQRNEKGRHHAAGPRRVPPLRGPRRLHPRGHRPHLGGPRHRPHRRELRAGLDRPHQPRHRGGPRRRDRGHHDAHRQHARSHRPGRGRGVGGARGRRLPQLTPRLLRRRAPGGRPDRPRVRKRTVANCLYRRGRMVEEWVIRDELADCLQMGIDPDEAGRALRFQGYTGSMTEEPPKDVLAVGVGGSAPRRLPARVRDGAPVHRRGVVPAPVAQGQGIHGQGPLPAHGRRVRTVIRPERYQSDLLSLVGAFPDARFAVRDVQTNFSPRYAGLRVAVTWTMHGTYRGTPAFGPLTGRPVTVLGVSQFLIQKGRIVREYRVYDKISLRAQINSTRGDGPEVEANIY